MQALYAYLQQEDGRMDVSERRMLKEIDGIYDLYIYQLDFLVEIHDFAAEMMEIGKNKYFPTEEEKNPNTRFISSKLITLIRENHTYQKRREELKINWADHKELLRKIFNELRKSDLYIEYLASADNSIEADFRFYTNFYHEFLAENSVLQNIYEEMHLEWVNDYDIVSLMMVRTFEMIRQQGEKFNTLPSLFDSPEGNDEKEEKRFVTDLFRKTIIHKDKFDQLITEKVENWEPDRIAMMDMILLRMALCEFLMFEGIPVKVTINEYIELSKMYSSPKSKIFVNGMLDKMLISLREKGEIKKSGRGLIG
jgi:transcription antitermination protein NusB